jgi:cytochrome c-type biogenesis protein CcmE
MGISVVVQGRLGPDGVFHASEVIPRCPSRYEMDQRAGRGETMPHVLPPAPSPTPR